MVTILAMKTMTIQQFAVTAQRDDFIKAIQSIDSAGYVPKGRNSRKFCLVHPGGQFPSYPPKYVVIQAAKLRRITISNAHGGQRSNNLLQAAKFTVKGGCVSSIPER